jgi:hypothetical protein
MQYCCPIDDTDPPPRNHRNSNVTLDDESSISAEDMMSEDAIGVALENFTVLHDDLKNKLGAPDGMVSILPPLLLVSLESNSICKFLENGLEKISQVPTGTHRCGC